MRPTYVGPAFVHCLGAVGGKLNRTVGARLGRKLGFTGAERQAVDRGWHQKNTQKGTELVPESHRHDTRYMKS